MGRPAGANPRPQPSGNGLLITALSLAMATGATGTYTLAALSPFLTREFGLTPAVIGLLVCAIYITAATSSGVIGRRADRVDPVRIILLGSTCSLAATLAFASSPNVILLVVFAVLAGIAMAASNPGSNGMIARRLPPGSRAFATGIKQSGATGTGIYVASIVPTFAVIAGWRVAALASVVIPLAAIATVLWSRRGPVNELDMSTVSNAAEHPTQSRWLRWLSLYALLLGFATGICNGFYVLFAAEQLGFEEIIAGFVFALFGVASVFARVIWAQLAERGMNIGRLLMAIGAIGATSALLCLLAPVIGAWAIWVAAALAGSSIVGWNALAFVTIMKRVRINEVGAFSSRMLRAFFFGLALGPLMFGMIVQVAGYPIGWLVQLVALVLAVVVAANLGRSLQEVPLTPKEGAP